MNQDFDKMIAFLALLNTSMNQALIQKGFRKTQNQDLTQMEGKVIESKVFELFLV